MASGNTEILRILTELARRFLSFLKPVTGKKNRFLQKSGENV